METDSFNTEWESASEQWMASQGIQVARIDLETRDLRNILTKSLKEAWIKKPVWT